GSQNLPSARRASAVGRRPMSGHSVSLPVAGSKCATLNPPSSVTQNVPSVSSRGEFGAASRVNGQRVTVAPSGETLATPFSPLEAVQRVPSGSRTRFDESYVPPLGIAYRTEEAGSE